MNLNQVQLTNQQRANVLMMRRILKKMQQMEKSNFTTKKQSEVKTK